jgi:hypothetical protein
LLVKTCLGWATLSRNVVLSESIVRPQVTLTFSKRPRAGSHQSRRTLAMLTLAGIAVCLAFTSLLTIHTRPSSAVEVNSAAIPTRRSDSAT